MFRDSWEIHLPPTFVVITNCRVGLVSCLVLVVREQANHLTPRLVASRRISRGFISIPSAFIAPLLMHQYYLHFALHCLPFVSIILFFLPSPASVLLQSSNKIFSSYKVSKFVRKESMSVCLCVCFLFVESFCVLFVRFLFSFASISRLNRTNEHQSASSSQLFFLLCFFFVSFRLFLS